MKISFQESNAPAGPSARDRFLSDPIGATANYLRGDSPRLFGKPACLFFTRSATPAYGRALS